MKATEIDVRSQFRPVLGTRPWRVKLGVGSFLTFDFGTRIRENGHIHGQWHLWIYLSNWVLLHGERQLADSDSERKVIMTAMRRLDAVPLTQVDFDPHAEKTKFVFEDFRLIVSPADYLDDRDERDEFWMFFMPDNEVLAVGPKGVKLERSSPEADKIARHTNRVFID